MKTSFVRPVFSGATARREGGFAIVSAIFLLVVLALMAAFIVHISTHQQAGHTADLRGVRAYQAARAGIEWGLHNHTRNLACAATSSFAPGGNLSEFTVTVTCLPAGVATTNDENGTLLVVRRIVATACNQPTAGGDCPNLAPGDNYIERELAAVVSR
jgi:MSHA biogenesis protein MshP